MKKIILLASLFCVFTSFLNNIDTLKGNSALAATSTNVDIYAEKNRGGTLVMSSIGEPSNLITMLSTDSASHEIASFLFVSVLKYDKDYNIIPDIAKSFEVLDDGKHLKFELRDDVYWQDGTQLTADDVTFTYNITLDPLTPTAYATDFQQVKEYKQTGKFSFEVFYDSVYSRSLISWMASILPKHILENQDIVRTPFSRKPIGAGPFILEEWKSGTSITLKSNPRYFNGQPPLSKIVYRIIPDSSTIFLEARNRAIDFFSPTPQQYLKQTNTAQWTENWNKFKYLSPSYTYLGFNLENALFQDKRVRQAMSYAVDRETLIKSVLLGLGESTVGPYMPNTWVYNSKLTPYAFNLEKAQSLLAEAGWKLNKNNILEKDGQEFVFTVITNQGNDLRIKTATLLQAYFKKVGIEMKIRTIEWSAFINEFIHKGNFEATLLGWNILQDPDSYNVWHSSGAIEGGLNFIRYKNSEVDSMLELGRATLDDAKRTTYYHKFQEILHEEQPYLFLYVPYALPMVQKRFKNIKTAPAGISYNIDQWYVPKSLQIYK